MPKVPPKMSPNSIKTNHIIKSAGIEAKVNLTIKTTKSQKGTINKTV